MPVNAMVDVVALVGEMIHRLFLCYFTFRKKKCLCIRSFGQEVSLQFLLDIRHVVTSNGWEAPPFASVRACIPSRTYLGGRPIAVCFLIFLRLSQLAGEDCGFRSLRGVARFPPVL